MLILDPDMFASVITQQKTDCTLELRKAEDPLQQYQNYIKQLADAFPTIKFDPIACCFYNEVEDMLMAEQAKPKRGAHHPSKGASKGQTNEKDDDENSEENFVQDKHVSKSTKRSTCETCCAIV